jgi:hypothetical protein
MAPQMRGSIGMSLHKIFGSKYFDNDGKMKNWNTVDNPLTEA